MAMVNLELPEPMKAWVEARAKNGHFDDAGAYLRDLIRRDQERQGAVAELQALIDEGLASGVSARTPAEIQAAARTGARV